MKLSLLLKQVPVQNTYEDREITFITDDSRKIQPGCAFVCIKGNHFDGHDAAFDAVRRGAAAVIVQHSVGCEGEVITSNTRAAYSLMCAAFFGEPAKKLRLIGVTGTNGKTTTTFLIKEILDMFGKKSGLIGTVVNMIDRQTEPAALTTPESFALQQLFAKMVQAGCEYCVMEVSSQALSQGRVEGCMFEVAVFTNLTQDHLDYHGNFENYAAAKAILFSQCKKAVLNSDDPAWHRMICDSSCPYVTYAQKQQADYRAAEIQYAQTGVRYQLRHAEQCFDTAIGIPGEFSVYNSLCAITALAELGFSLADVVEKALYNTVLTVFGCGGDRDRTKRPLMGKVAASLSDYLFVTSDNPRTEQPEAIIADILAGLKDCSVPMVVEPSRTLAIQAALNEAKAGDTVLLAGKGHETYQILGTEKIHYDEREIVRDILAGKTGNERSETHGSNQPE